MVVGIGRVQSGPLQEKGTEKANERGHRAFERLWERERPRIWRLTARLSGSADAADDLTQEVGIRALQAYQNFRGNAAGATWLYRIAVNVVLRWREQDKQRPNIEWDTVAQTLPAADASPEQRTLRLDAAEHTRRAIDALPEELRTPLLLHVWEGMKYREIAELLDVPQGTVMSRLNTARKRLRERLEREGRGENAL
jgi:RNA polymerase sigma-70 factor, ECF subfamily